MEVNEDILVITGPSNIDNALIFIGVVAAAIILYAIFVYMGQNIKDEREEEKNRKGGRKNRKDTSYPGSRVWETMNDDDDVLNQDIHL